LLNRNLASAIDLERQAKQADWNVKGPNFIALHVLPWKERSRK
jgi:starvation-inducible DNA-binding protein